MQPLVSVILPVYNGEATLADAVRSILGQTFVNFELIAINDGSTDGSLAMLRDFAARDSRVKVLSRPNTGIAGALNDGVASSQGELLARMDADDISLPTRFEKQVHYLSEHPDCVLLGSRVVLVEPFGTPVYETQHKLMHEQIVEELLGGIGWAVVHPAAMMRRKAVRGVGGYRADRVPIEDLDLFLRLAQVGKITNLPDVLLHYRQHLESTNHKRFHEQESKKLACITDAYARLGRKLPEGWALPPRHMLSTEEELSQWAWAALKHHNLLAARTHALSVLRLKPASLASWRLLYCAVRGR